MMGPKTVREIRDELRRGLGAAGDDPIQWLERLMNDQQYQDAKGRSEVLESLRRFLEAGQRQKRRKRRAGTKK